MRLVRLLFVLAIISGAVYVAYKYRESIKTLANNAPPRPKQLPDGTNATADDWHWEKSSGDGPNVVVRAKNFRQIQEPDRFELEKVDLKIYRKDGKSFDHVLSDHAVFDMGKGTLYSEGEAHITMGQAEGEEPAPGRLVHIKSSGIHFDSKTGKAETDREATFVTERGEGKAKGAIYDPSTRELFLRNQVELVWHDDSGEPRPMKVEAQEVTYKENESKVLLSPTAKLTRDDMTLEGLVTTVTLDKNGIRLVETTSAKGSDIQDARRLDYAADSLTMTLNESSQVEHIKGVGNAKLITTTDYGVTTTTTNQIDLNFEVVEKQSTLKNALATGNSVVESKPAIREGRPTPESRILRSEIIEMTMRSGGREIETIDTNSPGVLEFMPNGPGQRKRKVEGERFHFAYGADNQVESFRTSKATTTTENEPRQGKPVPPSITASKEMQAFFAPKSSEMTRLEQWGDFRYEQGERKARAERAMLDNAANRITLLQSARVNDSTGSTTADQIILDQKTEDFQAEGNVQSSRMPDKKGNSSAMLSKDEPLQAKAAKMRTSDKQSLVVYDGDAILWQAGSRLQADHIEIDRKNSQLRANGKVVNQLLEQQSEEKKKAKNAPPAYTLIHAPSMNYNDKDRVAHYTGGAFLRRDDMDVKANEIKAYLKEDDKEHPRKEGESSLDRAAADGQVVILQATPGRTRRGTSEHADYYVDESKVVLEGGQPAFEDSIKGNTRGRQLTYFSKDDRLLVNGAPSAPAVSKIRRKPDASSSNKRTQ